MPVARFSGSDVFNKFDFAREKSYSTPLANSTLLATMLVSLATQKNSPSPTKTPTTIFSEYDYVIVGAGTAGSTVAGRLSEISCVSVLLLEAGPAPPIINDIPVFAKKFLFSDLDWQYLTVPQKHTGKGLVNNQIEWPSGRGLGGSSLLNSMFFVRGNKKDYDDWAAQGAEGWSYKDVLYYFKKLENNKNPEYAANDDYHGVGGPVTVENPDYHSEIKDKLLEAAKEIGFEIVDSNGPTQTGFNDFQGNVRRQQRCSTAKAYLVPAENRTNLHILPNAFVNKVILSGTKAVGVLFEVNGTLYEVKARREVIMSAGTINTAQLLMLSGIGPEKELVKHKIPLVADLPVGENLQNHCGCVLNFELSSEIPSLADKLSDRINIKNYIRNRKGPLTGLDAKSAMAFLNNRTTNPSDYYPTYKLLIGESSVPAKRQSGLSPEIHDKMYGPYEEKPFYDCYAQLLKPKSRGSVTLQSSNPRDPPLIDPNYFAHSDDLDEVVEAMKACKRIGTSKPMMEVGSKPFDFTFPGCEDFVASEDDYFRCQARSVVVTSFHQVGTARMGRIGDNSTVVDPQLKVKGIQGLRVVDASIMPIIPSGNTNYPTIMVAEKGSDIIKNDIICENEQKT